MEEDLPVIEMFVTDRPCRRKPVEEVSAGDIVYMQSAFCFYPFLVLESMALINLGTDHVKKLTMYMSGMWQEKQPPWGILMMDMATYEKELVGYLPGREVWVLDTPGEDARVNP